MLKYLILFTVMFLSATWAAETPQTMKKTVMCVTEEFTQEHIATEGWQLLTIGVTTFPNEKNVNVTRYYVNKDSKFLILEYTADETGKNTMGVVCILSAPDDVSWNKKVLDHFTTEILGQKT